VTDRFRPVIGETGQFVGHRWDLRRGGRGDLAVQRAAGSAGAAIVASLAGEFILPAMRRQA